MAPKIRRRNQDFPKSGLKNAKLRWKNCGMPDFQKDTLFILLEI
jgi:hypothetical protein